MRTLLQVQEPVPGQGPYWLDVSRNDDTVPRSDFSPVCFVTDVGRISSTLHEFLPGANLRAPFFSGPSTHPQGPGLSVDLLVCDCGNDGNSTNAQESSLCNDVVYFTYQSWANASRGYFTFGNESYGTEFYSLNYTGDRIVRSLDLAYLITSDGSLAVWVNGTDFNPIGDYEYGKKAVPQVSFPFTRLASINMPGSSYLYHQINETTLAEEQYDFSLQQWVTTYIPVPNP